MPGQLSQKELTLLQDQINNERLLVAKFNSYAAQTTDPQLRSMCQQIAQRHQQHYNTLLQFLGQ